MNAARLVLCAALLSSVVACASSQEPRRQDEARCAAILPPAGRERIGSYESE